MSICKKASSSVFAVREINHKLQDCEKVNTDCASLQGNVERSGESPLLPLRFLMNGRDLGISLQAGLL
jgi:hypothetical protein